MVQARPQGLPIRWTHQTVPWRLLRGTTTEDHLLPCPGVEAAIMRLGEAALWLRARENQRLNDAMSGPQGRPQTPPARSAPTHAHPRAMAPFKQCGVTSARGRGAHRLLVP